MKKLLAIPVFALLLFVGCASLVSILGTVADWAPFGASVFSGFVAIVAPANTQLPAEATAIANLITTVASDAAAAQQAGASSAGVAKVIADIQAVDSQIPGFESALSSAGVSLSATDKTYINASAALVLSTLEGYEAVIASKSSTTTTAQNVARLQAVSAADGCVGFTPSSTTVHLDEVSYQPAHLWANCATGADNYDLELTAAGTLINTKTGKPVTKPPTIANWKRQFNAIAKKYGHPEKELKLSTRDHVVHILTLGTK